MKLSFKTRFNSSSNNKSTICHRTCQTKTNYLPPLNLKPNSIKSQTCLRCNRTFLTWLVRIKVRKKILSLNLNSNNRKSLSKSHWWIKWAQTISHKTLNKLLNLLRNYQFNKLNQSNKLRTNSLRTSNCHLRCSLNLKCNHNQTPACNLRIRAINSNGECNNLKAKVMFNLSNKMSSNLLLTNSKMLLAKWLS